MKALYNISYGIYILTAKGDKNNGCVINTLMQVTSNPCRISITVNKDNYTTKMIEKTGEFNVSILDTMTKFDLIQRFGFSSGKDVDKFDGFDGFAIAKNNIPYITSHTNSYLSAKVVSKTDVGTHITFVADVTEDVVLRETEPATYAYYLSSIKPKPITQTKRVYVCRICGYVYEGEELPSDFICPLCKHGAEFFDIQGDKKETQSETSKAGKKMYCPICGHTEDAENSNGICVLCGAKMIEV